MDDYQHGGYQTAEGERRRILDFSASISPLGVPGPVRRAIRQAAAQADVYPDPRCRRLREAIARAENQAAGRAECGSVSNRTENRAAAGTTAGTAGRNTAGRDTVERTAAGDFIPPEWILCGNGAADLIYRAVRAVQPVRAVLPAPTFSEYENAIRAAGCRDIVRIPLSAESGFQPDFPFFRRFMGSLAADGGAAAVGPEAAYPHSPGTAAGPRIAFLCQPNNPTGVSIPRPVLLQILEQCRDNGTALVVDESFLPFLDQPEDATLSAALGAFHNLLILRSFTKLYGLAGVRLGYALCGDRDLLDRMDRSGPPWSVSSLAQAAGLAALDSGSYADRVRRLVRRERPRLLAGLDALGLRTIPGEANFLLFRSPVPLDEPLRKRGVILRNCGDFHGLDPSWYRTAVGTGRANRRLLAELGRILEPPRR